jgi:hypothetical protein
MFAVAEGSMKYVLIAGALLASLTVSAPVKAGSGSEACVSYCEEAASEHYERNTPEWSAFFNGCMRTCFKK